MFVGWITVDILFPLLVCLSVWYKKGENWRNSRVIGSKLEEMEQKTIVYREVTDAELLKRNMDQEYDSGWYVHEMMPVSVLGSKSVLVRSVHSHPIYLVVYRKD